ncbi:hypothetical protein [uncultured Sunxiuqinia sp.]|uniref:hypothetical protein n=1 Tax=uncultured Sunxiuqinia sp. TaxID=1573825 RepID=UPI002AA69992|nr:hypothetical protein [uncultured Sunxiuqinia sp.]
MNESFGKKLNLTRIKRIKKFAGDYILKTDNTELSTNTQIIAPNSLAELNAEWNKKTFYNTQFEKTNTI